MVKVVYSGGDPANTGFQYLEDLATAYWYSEVLFASLKLKLFDHLDDGGNDLAALAGASGCDSVSLLRLLRVLRTLELVGESEGVWYNNFLASEYLVAEKPSYLGDFLLYRQYLQPEWTHLTKRLSGKRECSMESSALRSADPQEDYARRNFYYVRAMDALAREKADEIAEILADECWYPPILDVGGGAGALARALIRSTSHGEAFLFELPEVHQAARLRYPAKRDWEKIQAISGDFRTFRFSHDQAFGLIIMGNFLHAYSPSEARRLIEKACGLLLPEGLLVVHDYFPDMGNCFPHKGALYDLNMMLNTYNGACHRSDEVAEWLASGGMAQIKKRDLSTDSSLLIAAGPQTKLTLQSKDEWPIIAKAMGFRKAVPLEPEQVVVASWVREKCRSGCSFYGRKLQCPPHCLSTEETREILGQYTRCILLEDVPPGKRFHERLLALERKAFLSGFYKALAFGAGPCPVCTDCPDDGICRKPEQSRPSMEGAGMDVYTTVRNAGMSLQPVKGRNDYVKYFGLLLLE